jgi:hypothetical protein
MNKVIATIILYLLAAPIYLVRWIIESLRVRRIAMVLRQGSIPCPYDRTPIPLARMNTCPCGFVSPSALVLVPCEFCGTVPDPPFVQCPTCGATVKVEVP